MERGWRGRLLRKSTAGGWRKPPAATPTPPKGTIKAPPLGAQQQKQHTQMQQQWVPTVRADYPHPHGATVTYQRPDMAQPRVARIAHRGAHGATLEHPDGSKAQARWESIGQTAKLGVDPKEADEAHGVLSQMGIEIDPVHSLLQQGQPEQGDAELQEQLKLLAGAGAPIRADRIKTAKREHIQALVSYLRGGGGTRRS